MKLDRETQWWTTHYRTAQALKWFGFEYEVCVSFGNRQLFVFKRSDELGDTFNFYQNMRKRIGGQNDEDNKRDTI